MIFVPRKRHFLIKSTRILTAVASIIGTDPIRKITISGGLGSVSKKSVNLDAAPKNNGPLIRKATTPSGRLPTKSVEDNISCLCSSVSCKLLSTAKLIDMRCIKIRLAITTPTSIAVFKSTNTVNRNVTIIVNRSPICAESSRRILSKPLIFQATITNTAASPAKGT